MPGFTSWRRRHSGRYCATSSGSSGRGPTRCRSPRSTFNRFGSSSSEQRRSARPITVFLPVGRNSNASMSSILVSTRCSCTSGTVMERNLIMSKGRSSLPTRFCMKNTGPGDSSLINSAISANKGLKTTRPSIEMATSQKRRARSSLSPLFGNDRLNGFDDAVDVRVLHEREQGQRDQALELGADHRIVLRLKAVVLAIVRVVVHGEIVHRRANAALLQLTNERVAVDLQTVEVQSHYVKVPVGRYLGPDDRRLDL